LAQVANFLRKGAQHLPQGANFLRQVALRMPQVASFLPQGVRHLRKVARPSARKIHPLAVVPPLPAKNTRHYCAVARLRGCAVARLRGCAVARLRGCAVARLRGCAVAKAMVPIPTIKYRAYFTAKQKRSQVFLLNHDRGKFG
jgi:hypothetical protein